MEEIDIKKRKTGPKIRFHDERHRLLREANKRLYWRKKLEEEQKDE